MISTTIVGNLTRDPVMHRTNPDAPQATFTVASNRKYTVKGGEQRTDTTFFDVVVWHEMAEHVGVSLHKGDRVLIHGHIDQSTYSVTDAEGNGKTRNRLRLVANAIGPDLRFATAEVTRIAKGEKVTAPEPVVEAPTAA